MDKSDSKIYINKYGTKRYKNSKGYYHRLDGPAIEWLNGDKAWYKEGKGHMVQQMNIQMERNIGGYYIKD